MRFQNPLDHRHSRKCAPGHLESRGSAPLPTVFRALNNIVHELVYNFTTLFGEVLLVLSSFCCFHVQSHRINQCRMISAESQPRPNLRWCGQAPI